MPRLDLGPNGAGKSTVFNLITGVYRPTGGSILLREGSIVGLHTHQIVIRGVSRTFQNIRLFPGMTVLENVQTAAAHCRHGGSVVGAVFDGPSHRRGETAIEDEGRELLRQVGLESLSQEMAGRLPYGAQRRLEIARALATRPSLLLLDEPAAGMNPKEKEELTDLLRSVHGERGVALLLIEHDMGVVMGLCPRIAVLDYGKKIAEGTPREIRENPRVIEAYLGPDECALQQQWGAGMSHNDKAPFLEVRDLRARLRADSRALKEINLEVARGEVVALIGANGRGQRRR